MFCPFVRFFVCSTCGESSVFRPTHRQKAKPKTSHDMRGDMEQKSFVVTIPIFFHKRQNSHFCPFFHLPNKLIFSSIFGEYLTFGARRLFVRKRSGLTSKPFSSLRWLVNLALIQFYLRRNLGISAWKSSSPATGSSPSSS